MKMDPGITGRAIQMTMTDRLWAQPQPSLHWLYSIM